MHFLRDTGLYSSVQVFNLAILPGTAFRQEAEMHGLQFQPRPPYYVLKTPTIDLATMYGLMEEAEEIFDTEFDALPSPAERREPIAESRHPTFAEYAVDLDDIARDPLPLPAQRQGAFELRLQSTDFRQHRDEACRLIRQLLDDNPHSTLRIVLEPTGDPASLKMSFLQAIRTACLKEPSYLDRFYSMQLGRPKGAKHIVIRLPWSERESVGLDWIDDVGQFASIVWTGENIPSEDDMTEELEGHEFVLASCSN